MGVTHSGERLTRFPRSRRRVGDRVCGGGGRGKVSVRSLGAHNKTRGQGSRGRGQGYRRWRKRERPGTSVLHPRLERDRCSATADDTPFTRSPLVAGATGPSRFARFFATRFTRHSSESALFRSVPPGRHDERAARSGAGRRRAGRPRSQRGEELRRGQSPDHHSGGH